MITWLDYKPSPRRLSICLSQREQQNIVAQSVTPKYHHWASCFYFLFKFWKVLNLLFFSAHKSTTWMDYKPSSSFGHKIWWSGNLWIWQQSGSNLAAIWQQSGNLGMAILHNSSINMLLAMVMAMSMAMAMCHMDCCWNNISTQARRTQRQRTQPFSILRGSRFSKLKITNRNFTMGWVTQNGEQHVLNIFIPFGFFFGREKINKTWQCEKTKIQQIIARENTSTHWACPLLYCSTYPWLPWQLKHATINNRAVWWHTVIWLVPGRQQFINSKASNLGLNFNGLQTIIMLWT